MSFPRRPLLALILASAALLAACTTEPKDDAGAPTGGGDFDVAAGVFYGDTAYTPVGLFRASGVSYQNLDSNVFMVQGGGFSHKKGDSTLTNIGASVQVRIGKQPPTSGVYDVVQHYGTLNDLVGKASLFIAYLQNDALDRSHADSSAGARVKVVVTGDSVQVIGKNIKLQSGKKISFNLTTKKTP